MWDAIGFSVWLSRLVSGDGDGLGYVNPGDSSWRGHARNDFSDAWGSLLEHAIWVPLVVMAVLVLVALLVALVWVSSRGKFIFLDNVVQGRGRIVEPWTRFAREGNSLFLWRVGFGLACILLFGLVALAVIGPAVGMSWNNALSGLSIATMVLGGMMVAVFAVAVAVISLFLDSFIVPIMYRYRVSTMAAWRYFTPWLTAYPVYFVLYVLLVLLLYIGLGLITVLLCLFTCCLIAIPLIGSYIEAVALLPLWITYRAFSVEFLAQFDQGFDLFSQLPPAPESPAPAPATLIE